MEDSSNEKEIGVRLRCRLYLQIQTKLIRWAAIAQEQVVRLNSLNFVLKSNVFPFTDSRGLKIYIMPN